jgi:hypothetical protein
VQDRVRLLPRAPKELERLRGGQGQFQVFLHPPKGILAMADWHGLMTALYQPGLVRHVAALKRGT